jgi:hypothetical protein
MRCELTTFILRDATSAIAAWMLGAFACGLISVLALDAVVAALFGAQPPLLARARAGSRHRAIVARLLLWKTVAESRRALIAASPPFAAVYLAIYRRRPRRRIIAAVSAGGMHAAVLLA